MLYLCSFETIQTETNMPAEKRRYYNTSRANSPNICSRITVQIVLDRKLRELNLDNCRRKVIESGIFVTGKEQYSREERDWKGKLPSLPERAAATNGRRR